MSKTLNIHHNVNSGLPVIAVSSVPFLLMGTAVPADGTAGYHKGCVYIKTDGGVGSTFYVNEGSATSCDFNAK